VTVEGFDTSHFNATLPSFAGQAFAANKCTQGTSFVDSSYATRHSVVRQGGLTFMAYMFGTMSANASAQVSHFVNTANILAGDIVALDWENPADGSADDWVKWTATQIRNQALKILSDLRAEFPHNRVVIYMNRSAYKDLSGETLVSTVDGLWIASPGATPTMPYLFWQYSVTGGIDRDHGNFTNPTALKEWANPTMTSPTDTALAVAQYKNASDPTDVDAHQHWVDATDTKKLVQTLTTTVGTLTSAVNAITKQLTTLTTAVGLLQTGDTLSIPNGTTFTASVPAAATTAAEVPGGTA
jgi:hypothetical protein